MFKKDPGLKPVANLKSSERRKLLNTICSLYGLPRERLAKEAEEALLPSTTKQGSYKSQLGSGTIYTDENKTPVWFKPKDSQIMPTLYTLWKCPYVVPVVKTHPHVIKVLAGGADLMLPGTIPPFDSKCLRGSVVGVVDSASPTVIKAVGYARLNLTQFDYVIGRTGVAVEIAHCLDDELFKLCDMDIKMPVELSLEIPLKEEEPLPVVSETQETQETKEVSEEPSPEVPESSGSSEHELLPSDDQEVEELVEKVDKISVEDADYFFKRALFQTITADSVELPISFSQFMEAHILKNLQVEATIKDSSWGKSIKFLNEMMKQNYLKLKGKGNNLMVLSFATKDENEDLKNFIPYKVKKAAAKEPVSNRKDKSIELKVVYLYKPTSKSRPLFNKIDGDFLKLYNQQELKDVLNSYISAADLVDPKSPQKVILNDILSSITQQPNGSIHRNQIFPFFLKNFTPNYQIFKPNSDEQPSVIRGDPPKIEIISEMRLGRKIVTRVSNFEAYYIKPQAFADELKVKCSGSTTIGACVHNPKITEVTVQGPHGKLITDLLTKKGVPASFMEFTDKTRKSKKRTT